MDSYRIENSSRFAIKVAIMKKLMKLYIETSVPNMLFHDDAPDKQEATMVFFDWLRISSHDVCTSRITLDELTNAPEPKRSLMLQTLTNARVVMLETGNRELVLAEAYVREAVLP